MPNTQDRSVMLWLMVFAFSVAFLVVWGGYTRLTRSGLSIVEWHPVSGVVPPMGAQAWQDEFTKYQQTPEFEQVNFAMTLDEYRYIFYIEWIHRMLARLIGLLYAIPLFYFLFTRKIPWRESGIYIAMGLLFILQAFAGWFMVASGLEQRPSVSHYLLTFHLLLALTLFSLGLWTVFGHWLGYLGLNRKVRFSLPSKLAFTTAVILLVQIIYGGLTAGLKAGHISDTWPQMLGESIPPGLLTTLQPWTLNLVAAPLTVAFIHRWLAFAVLVMAAAAYITARRFKSPRDAQTAALLLTGLIAAQVVLGIGVAVLHVKIELALLHQAVAIALLAVNLLALYCFLYGDSIPVPSARMN